MVITFLTMYNKNLFFLQYAWELQKHKSKYFSWHKIKTRELCLAKNYHELIIYNMII